MRVSQGVIRSIAGLLALAMIDPGRELSRSVAGSLAATPASTSQALVVPYLLAMLVTFVGIGVFDRRSRVPRRFSAAALGFAAASACCGAMSSLEALAGCRVLQGMFGAALFGMALAAPFQLFSGRRALLAAALFVALSYLMNVLRPTLTGFIVDNAGWAQAFFLVALASIVASAAEYLLGMVRQSAPKVRNIDRDLRFQDSVFLFAVAFLTYAGFSGYGVALDAFQTAVHFDPAATSSLAAIVAVLLCPLLTVPVVALHPARVHLRWMLAAALAVSAGAFWLFIWSTPESLLLGMLASAIIRMAVQLSCICAWALMLRASPIASLNSVANWCALAIVGGAALGSWSTAIVLEARREAHASHIMESRRSLPPDRLEGMRESLEKRGASAADIERLAADVEADRSTVLGVWDVLPATNGCLALAACLAVLGSRRARPRSGLRDAREPPRPQELG